MGKSLLKLENISKSFPGVKALKNINLEFQKGEIIGLVGENGAGKSTLMNIISGTYPPNEGKIYVNGEHKVFDNPDDAQKAGVSIIYQHRQLFPNLTVAENIFINRFYKKNNFIINYDKNYANTEKWLKKMELDIAPDEKVKNLSASEKQLVEIAKAYSKNPKILIMDEPTTALKKVEVKNLFNLVRNLKAKGTTIIFISHRLNEILEISDKIVIFRDGICVKQGEKEEFTIDEIVKNMSGHVLEEKGFGTNKEINTEDIILEAKKLKANNIKNLNFKLHKKEILGFAGLEGSGIRQLLECLFGLVNEEFGELYKNGKMININSPISAIKKGIGYLPEDRHKSGLFLGMNVIDNTAITAAQKKPSYSFINKKKEKDYTKEIINKLSINTTSEQAIVKYLSGGNQQKIVYGKWAYADSDILMMNEPTSGIDVAAKHDIYTIMDELAHKGKGIICTSSDLDELMKICDRIIVVYKGEIVYETLKKDFNKNKIYIAMNGEKLGGSTK